MFVITINFGLNTNFYLFIYLLCDNEENWMNEFGG